MRCVCLAERGVKKTVGMYLDKLSIEGLYGRIVLLSAVVHGIYLVAFMHSRLTALCFFEGGCIAALLLLLLAVRKRAFAVLIFVLHLVSFFTFAIGTLSFGWMYGFEFGLICMLLLERHFIYRSKITPNVIRAAEVMLLLVAGLLSLNYRVPFADSLELWVRNLLFVTNFTVLVVGVAANAVVGDENGDVAVMVLQEKASYLQHLADTDALTNLPNRRSMLQLLETALWQSRQTGRPLCVVMCDIDDFKYINDTYGHASGDFALKMIAETITEYLGDDDIVCRWGGEEFLVLLENTSLAQAKEIVNGLRRAVETTPFVYCGRILAITMTMGITQCWEGATVTELVEQADMLMYAGKRRGKNCVVPSR